MNESSFIECIQQISFVACHFSASHLSCFFTMSDGDDNDGRELGDDNGELNTKKRQRRHKSDEQHDIILAQPDGTYKLIHKYHKRKVS